ncbi:MAG TPA: EndoU domain-containing protein, partial [Archangium sp.]
KTMHSFINLRTPGILAVLSLVMCLSAASAQAQVNCTTLAHWSATAPPVNQIHIFCGEWDGTRPKGFHSRPGGLDPVTVGTFAITQPANAQGIYGASWSYAAHPTPSKYSTMFPDTCSTAQVLNSIAYAALNPTACPSTAPTWAWCGPSRPSGGNAANYCSSANGTVFTIAGASLGNGNVNTAFPVM